jgi:hypothetical protein
MYFNFSYQHISTKSLWNPNNMSCPQVSHSINTGKFYSPNKKTASGYSSNNKYILQDNDKTHNFSKLLQMPRQQYAFWKPAYRSPSPTIETFVGNITESLVELRTTQSEPKIVIWSGKEKATIREKLIIITMN